MEISYRIFFLRIKGLYIITLGVEDISIEELGKVEKWKKKNDQAHGLIGMYISLDLIFNIQYIYSPIEAWEKFDTIFGIKNEIRAHELENEFLTLDPKNVSTIEDFFLQI